MAFHVNPKTGNPGICRAKPESGRGCPFGGAEEHFNSREEARADYERKQEKFEQFLFKSKVPPTKGSYVLASYDPMSEEVPVGQLWGNPVYGKFSEKMAEADEDTRLVMENGQVWQKNSLYGNESWKFVSGPYDPLSRLEKGKSYDSSYLGNQIMKFGARLERGGSTPKIAVEHRRDVYPDREELQFEAASLRETFNEKSPAPDEQVMDEYVDDYISERWSGLTPHGWATIRGRIDEELGQKRNIGTEDEPMWVWSK